MPTTDESPTGMRVASPEPERTENLEVERDRGVDVGRLDSYVVEHGGTLEVAAEAR